MKTLVDCFSTAVQRIIPRIVIRGQLVLAPEVGIGGFSTPMSAAFTENVPLNVTTDASIVTTMGG
jgi:hypothetical protein